MNNDGRFMSKQLAMTNQIQHGETSSFPVDSSWYLDTGATDHLTNDVDKLLTKEKYKGGDLVHTANGTGMPVHHIGHAISPTYSSKYLKLQNVLHVPMVTKGLVSVCKLTQDNNAYVEFHPNYIFFKDVSTNLMLTRGGCRNGLYTFDLVFSDAWVRPKPLLAATIIM